MIKKIPITRQELANKLNCYIAQDYTGKWFACDEIPAPEIVSETFSGDHIITLTNSSFEKRVEKRFTLNVFEITDEPAHFLDSFTEPEKNSVNNEMERKEDNMNIETEKVETTLYKYKDAFGNVVHGSHYDTADMSQGEYDVLSEKLFESEMSYFAFFSQKKVDLWEEQITRNLKEIIVQKLHEVMDKYSLASAINNLSDGTDRELDPEYREYEAHGNDFKEGVLRPLFKECFETVMDRVKKELLYDSQYRDDFVKRMSNIIMDDMMSEVYEK